MSPLPLTAGCACGGVRLQVSQPLERAAYCHRRRCEKRTGAAASASARVAPRALAIVTGETLVRSWTPPGGGFAKAFCATCGSALWSRDPDDPDVVGIRLGAFDDGDPGVRQWTDSAAAWEPLPDDGLPRHPASAPAQKRRAHR